MYIVKSKVVARAPIRLGVNADWAVDQIREVDDDMILPYQNNPTAFTVLSGPGMAENEAALEIAITGAGVGAVPAASITAGVTAKDSGSGELRRTVLTLVSVPLTMTDAGVNGSHGAIELYDFPAGSIAFIGGTTNLSISAPAAGGIAAAAAIVGAVGTATNDAANATLTGTEADLIPSTASTLTALAGTTKGKSATAGIALFDGTATAKKAFLNYAIPDADSSATEVLTVSGTVTLVWANMGDN